MPWSPGLVGARGALRSVFLGKSGDPGQARRPSGPPVPGPERRKSGCSGRSRFRRRLPELPTRGAGDGPKRAAEAVGAVTLAPITMTQNLQSHRDYWVWFVLLFQPEGLAARGQPTRSGLRVALSQSPPAGRD